MINGYFDVEAFVFTFNKVRQERGVTWHAVFRDTGISRFEWSGKRGGKRSMSVHTMARLALWAEMDIQQFLKQEVKDGRTTLQSEMDHSLMAEQAPGTV